MVTAQVLLFCLVAIALTSAASVVPDEEQRTKRETDSAMAKFEETLKGFKEGFNNLVKNISESDIYKQFEKFSSDINDKGKELGAKIEESLSSLKKNAS